MLTPISPEGLATIPQGIVSIKLKGKDTVIELGNSTSASIAWSSESLEFFDNRRGKRVKAFAVPTDVTGTFEVEVNMLTDIVRQIAAGADKEVFVQAAASDQTYNGTGAAKDVAFKVPHVKISNVTMTDGSATPVSYVLGTHFEVDSEVGFVRILAMPAGADTDVEITYDAGAVVEADGFDIMHYASNLDLRGTVYIRSTNDVGVRTFSELYDVQLKANGGRGYIVDGNEFITQSITGSIFAAAGKPSGKEFGYELKIS